jgi:hypothetical protein
MKGLRATLFISMLLLLGAVIAAPAVADAPPTPVEPVQLALGDSWAFGFGATRRVRRATSLSSKKP